MAIELRIEDGTAENLRYDSHKRSKCWVAIVEKDMSQPGHLRRLFLARAPGGRVMVGETKAGDWLEFAGDYYSARGRKQASRSYYRVLERNNHLGHLLLEPCEAGDVGRQGNASLGSSNPLADYSDDEIRAEYNRRGL